eukprot:5548437-Pleurochrysis_carterae.AAC.1
MLYNEATLFDKQRSNTDSLVCITCTKGLSRRPEAQFVSNCATAHSLWNCKKQPMNMIPTQLLIVLSCYAWQYKCFLCIATTSVPQICETDDSA